MSNEQGSWTDEHINEAYLNWQRTAIGRVDTTAFVRHVRDDMQAEIDALEKRVETLEAQLESANESYREELLEHDPFKYDALYGDDDDATT